MRKWISRAGEGGVFGEPTNATQRFECGAMEHGPWGGGYKEPGRADLDLILDSAPTPRGAVIHPDQKVIWTFMVEPVAPGRSGAKVSAHR